MLRDWMIGAAATAALAVSLAPQAGAQVVADFEDDWDRARTNGVGIVGADDTPEQGHADTAGTGRWFYHEVNGQTFAQTPLVWDQGLDVYDRADSGGFEIPLIGRAFTHPAAPAQFSNRLWNTLLPAGTQIRIQGEVSDADTGGGDGQQFVLIQNNDVGSPLVNIMTNSATPTPFDVTVTLPDNGAQGNFFNFAVGVGPAGNQDFDSTNYTATISIVPEPAGLALAAAGAIGLLARRRRQA